MAKWFILYSVFLVNLGCAQSTKRAENEFQNKVASERMKLRNAAFCNCLYKSFPEKDSIFSNEGSGAAYLELGAHSLDAYLTVMESASLFAKKIYRSKNNRNLAIMKCLDFYNSKQLEELIKSLDSEIDKSKLK